MNRASPNMKASLAAREAHNVVYIDIAGAYLNAVMSYQEMLMRFSSTKDIDDVIVPIKLLIESMP